MDRKIYIAIMIERKINNKYEKKRKIVSLTHLIALARALPKLVLKRLISKRRKREKDKKNCFIDQTVKWNRFGIDVKRTIQCSRNVQSIHAFKSDLSHPRRRFMTFRRKKKLEIRNAYIFVWEIMDDRTVDLIFAGSLESLPAVSSKIVRIFTSSTFTGKFSHFPSVARL